jgi:hypothetical protein
MPATTYTVRPGDSLGLIASRFGVSLTALVSANVDRYPTLRTQPGRIQAGWTFAIPSAEPASGQPSNDRILYVGMNPGSTYESAALRGTGAPITAIHDSAVPDQVTGPGGRLFDVSTEQGAADFVATLGLSAEQSAAVASAIFVGYPDARDELARIAQAWAPAERGGTMPSRLVLSGHSGGSGVWGEDNGVLTLDSIGRLAEAMPEAARRVEDVHIAGCYSGGAYAMERLRAIFPRVKTIWAYSGSAPAAGPVAARHQVLWERATRGSRTDLDRAIVEHVAGGEKVAVWSMTGGYQDGHPPRPYAEVRADMDLLAPTFDAFFRGEEVVSSPQSGPLRDYYNALQACLQHPDLPASDRAALESRRDVTIRLIYYAATVARRFAAHFASAIEAGFSSVGLPAPDFAALSRRDALASIAAFEPRGRAPGAPPAAVALLQILEGLVQLDRAVIPDTWV